MDLKGHAVSRWSAGEDYKMYQLPELGNPSYESKVADHHSEDILRLSLVLPASLVAMLSSDLPSEGAPLSCLSERRWPSDI